MYWSAARVCDTAVKHADDNQSSAKMKFSLPWQQWSV